MRTLLLCLALALAALASPPAVRGETLTLVENGEPRVSIVIPGPAKASKQPDFTKPAAGLQDLLHRISGAKLEVVTLDQWKQKSAGRPAIFLGCAAAENGLPAVENEEGSRVQSQPAGLLFAVSAKASAEVQQSAMEHAVNRFAEKVLGCRWLMPGELGRFCRRTRRSPSPTVRSKKRRRSGSAACAIARLPATTSAARVPCNPSTSLTAARPRRGSARPTGCTA